MNSPGPEPTVISTSPGPELTRQVEPIDLSEQGLWHCSNHLQTPREEQGVLNVLKEEKNIHETQRKLHIRLGLNFKD